jgi:catechol 2,3-dioxygenase-like lactoylglutathione lyase family enzyme
MSCLVPHHRLPIVQVMVSTRSHDESVRFYAETFGLSFNADISSFQFGTYGTESYFLLTIENWYDEGTPSCIQLSQG